MSYFVLVLLIQDPGLLATCSDGQRQVAFAVPTPNFTLDENHSIHPSLRPEFSAVFSGGLKILRAGRYTLHGDAKILLDGHQVQGRPVDLGAGEHPLRIEYSRPKGPAQLRVEWESDSFKREPVPYQAFVRREKPTDKSEPGRELVARLQCMACHKEPIQGSDLGRSQIRAAWLYDYLDSPRHVRLLSEPERRDVTAFLAKDLPADKIDEDRARQGKELYDSIGCVACHGESVAGMGSKTNIQGLSVYLREPRGAMPSLSLNPDEADLIAEHLIQSKSDQPPAPAGDPKRGKEIVSTRGCLNCHTLHGASAPVKAAPLAGSQCKVARFDADLKAIEEFVQIPDVSPAPVYETHRLIRALKCNACHDYFGTATFAVAEAPPTLTDAGNKLRETWVESVLLQKRRIRPWMALRMPHFGDQLKPLVQGLARVCGATPGNGEITQPKPDHIKEGIRLIGKGEQGLSCITCHDFSGVRSLGTRGPDMTQMADRLRPEWFRRWMREPSRIQPGTMMPQFFGSLPEAQVDQKLDLLWACLSAGKNMPLPSGLEETQSFKLLVKDDPIVIRTFMPGSSPRSIAVGLPGMHSFCFDAAQCRVRYAWFGDFLDVTPVWAGRGGEAARLLGKKYYTAPKEFPLRIGENESKPVFIGYELVNKIPVFRYRVDGIEVRQTLSPAPQGLGLSMTFEMGSVDRDVTFIGGDGATWSSTVGTWENGRLKIPAGSKGTFTVTFVIEEKQ